MWHITVAPVVHQTLQIQRHSEVGHRALECRWQDLISHPDLMMAGLDLGERHLPSRGLLIFLAPEQPRGGARSFLGLAEGTEETTTGLRHPPGTVWTNDNRASQRFAYHGFFSRESALPPPLIKVIHYHHGNIRKYRITRRQEEKSCHPTPSKGLVF